jgi:hypothetical protein
MRAGAQTGGWSSSHHGSLDQESKSPPWRVPRPGVQADSCQIGSRAAWINESGMGQVDPSALHVERAEDNAEETEAAQVAEATWWERGGRPAGGGVVLGRERET